MKLEVARGRLQAIVDEAGAALIRTAFSHVIRDARDFACAVLTTEGQTVVQSSQSIPVFFGTMTLTARHLLARFPIQTWQPGDVIGTNDPWLGTGHLYDLTVLTPVVVDGEIVAFSGVVAHLPDIGGRIVGPDAAQCFEEGLRIPPMRVATRDGIDPVLLEILKANVRLPEQVLGDVDATFNASSVIGRSLGALCREISAQRFREVCLELEARTEAFMRRAIAELPDGSYPAGIESEGIGGVPFIPGLIFNALAAVMPERTIAECGAPRPGMRIAGVDTATGALFTAPILVPGGFGARATKDGLPCLAFPTNASTVPVEMIEAVFPLRFEAKELLTDSGGPGQFQGGLGQRVTVRCLTESVQASVVAQRLTQPPRGIQGGGAGSRARVLVNGVEVANPSGNIRLVAGDTITLESPGAGGFGDPRRRDPARVQADIEDGHVSAEKAGRVFDRD